MTAADVKSGRTEATGIVRWQTPALVVGIIALVVAGIGFTMNAQEAFRAWLPAFIFWFYIAAGSLGILMLQYVTGGEWGIVLRRPLGAAARTLPLFFLFGLPIAFGLAHIYLWADHDAVAHDHLLQAKTLWLNPTGWVVRSLIYLVLLSLWAWRIRFLSVDFARTRSPYTDASRRRWSAIGLVMIVMVLTFAGIDWVMSLEPKWYSSMFGISFTIGAGLSAFAFSTMFLASLARNPAMTGIVKSGHLRDLGNLMLAFVMLWAYTAFSQFLLIWYGNLKEEVPYYTIRSHGAWGIIAAVLIVFHFFLPFFLLLMRRIKDDPRTISIVGVLILVMRFVETYWLIGPAHYPAHFYFSWITIFAWLGIGGVWVFFFVQQLKGQTIIPVHETWVEEAIREGALTRNA